jgi:branched-chain amino acid aminotransferase
MQYYNLSGKITNTELNLSIDNRAFRYGDSIFESMFFSSNALQFIDLHYDRLFKGLQLLKIKPNCIPTKTALEQQIDELMQANEYCGSARIRWQIFRKSGGFYFPNSNDCDYIIEIFPLNNTRYCLNENGLQLGIAKSVSLDQSPFNAVKTSSKLSSVLAAIEANESLWDDAILLNQTGRLAESSKANLFVVKNNTIITPPSSEGILEGIMRQLVIQAASENDFAIQELPIAISDLQVAEEVFITNVIIGIQWVAKIENKLYETRLASSLLENINRKLKIARL